MDNSVRLPVIAVIPNYNMAASLTELLPQVLRQGYDAVYVLDDFSTDDSKKVVARFGPAVTWVGGTVNLGAGGNRNRILAAHKAECIIHFLDADVRLETNTIPANIRQAMRQQRTAFVGGLIEDLNGKPFLWNYGPDCISLYAQLTVRAQNLFGGLQAPEPPWRNVVRRLTTRVLSEWPDRAVTPKRRPVYWVAEANLFVRRSLFEKLGGFDANLRECDSIPPARKAYQAGLISYFDPSVVVRHLEVNVRHYNRRTTTYKELHLLIKRYGGWREWLWPEGHFKPRYNR